MERMQLLAIRKRLEPLANGQITDGNAAIKTLAATILELTSTPYEDEVEKMREAEFRQRVEDTHRAATAAGRGESETQRAAAEALKTQQAERVGE